MLGTWYDIVIAQERVIELFVMVSDITWLPWEMQGVMLTVDVIVL